MRTIQKFKKLVIDLTIGQNKNENENYELMDAVEKDLLEHEALKKDVNRFIELDNMLYLQGWHSKEETVEYQELRNKLSKVGNNNG